MVKSKSEKAERDPSLFWRHGLSSSRKIHITGNPNGMHTANTTITYYKMFLPDPKNEMVEVSCNFFINILDRSFSFDLIFKCIVSLLLRRLNYKIYNIAKDHDIFVMNFGLHVREQDKLKYGPTWMGPILKQLRRSNFTVLAHRETTAQHFDGAGGSFWRAKAKGKVPKNIRTIGGCTKLQSGDPESGWREPIVRSVANDTGFNLIVADESIREYRVITSLLSCLFTTLPRPIIVCIPRNALTTALHLTCGCLSGGFCVWPWTENLDYLNRILDLY